MNGVTHTDMFNMLVSVAIDFFRREKTTFVEKPPGTG